MSRASACALTSVGLASAWVGVFIGFAFGMPALGLNRYGRNSVEFTAVGEGFAALFYLFGAILQIRGGRVLGQVRRPKGKVTLLALVPMVCALVVFLVLGARNGDWEAILVALIFLVFVVAPILAGMLSVWMGFRSPPSRDSGPAGRRRGRQST
jgi:hypothetical protein